MIYSINHYKHENACHSVKNGATALKRLDLNISLVESDIALFESHVATINLQHEKIQSFIDWVTDQQQQHNPKKRKADYISARDDLHALIPEKSIDNKPLSVSSPWTRPNLFSGGYGNAFPSLEAITQTTTQILQQLQPIVLPSISATAFVHALVTLLANSVTCMTYFPYVLFAANQPSSLVVSAVPVDHLLKETPFRSTGPGPPTGDSYENVLNYFFDFSIFFE